MLGRRQMIKERENTRVEDSVGKLLELTIVGCPEPQGNEVGLEDVGDVMLIARTLTKLERAACPESVQLEVHRQVAENGIAQKQAVRFLSSPFTQ